MKSRRNERSTCPCYLTLDRENRASSISKHHKNENKWQTGIGRHFAYVAE